MFRLVFLLFLTFQNKNKNLNKVKITQEDLDFNNQLNQIVLSSAALGYLIPKILKKGEYCEKDDDCPLIMRCCEVGKYNYCCTPNNFVKLTYAFAPQNIDSKN